MFKKIMIADDDSKIRSIITDFLSDDGYEVIEAKNGREAIDIYELDPSIELIILDVMMPFSSGYDVCLHIRKRSSVPIIMLTAKTGEDDELDGFICGADEYITKPFRISILIARVNALYNRVYGNPEKDVIKRGLIEINIKEQVVLVNNTNIKLGNREYKILLYMIKHEKVVLSREVLLNNVWGYDYFGTDRTVDTTINRLRNKIRPAHDYIKTIPKNGYKFEVNKVYDEIN